MSRVHGKPPIPKDRERIGTMSRIVLVLVLETESASRGRGRERGGGRGVGSWKASIRFCARIGTMNLASASIRNIEHPTSNAEHRIVRRIGRWVFDVRCSMFFRGSWEGQGRRGRMVAPGRRFVGRM